MTAENLSMYAGVLLSLVFAYVPGVSPWYKALASDIKRLVMLAVLAITAGAIFGLACAGYWSGIVCDQSGAVELVKLFIAALIANQATFLVSPKPAKG
jgi:hypothetical protein